MDVRTLGSSNLKVSLVGLGCNNFGIIDLERARGVAHRAIDLGITLFDTADIYGIPVGSSEEALGAILGPRRKDIVLATKFGMDFDAPNGKTGASAAYIREQVETSLKRLKTDWIDLYQLHRPDPKTPIEETLGALDALVKQGKVRHIGCSNMPAWQVADAHWTAKTKGLTPFISAQDELSLVVRQAERELLPALERYGMGLLPFFPLASGLLTGKYKKGEEKPAGSRLSLMKRHADRYLTDANWAIVERLQKFAGERGHTMLELAFSWLAAKPMLSSVIAGATNPAQVEQNVKAVNWKLSPDDLAEIDKLSRRD